MESNTVFTIQLVGRNCRTVLEYAGSDLRGSEDRSFIARELLVWRDFVRSCRLPRTVQLQRGPVTQPHRRQLQAWGPR